METLGDNYLQLVMEAESAVEESDTCTIEEAQTILTVFYEKGHFNSR